MTKITGYAVVHIKQNCSVSNNSKNSDFCLNALIPNFQNQIKILIILKKKYLSSPYFVERALECEVWRLKNPVEKKNKPITHLEFHDFLMKHTKLAL